MNLAVPAIDFDNFHLSELPQRLGLSKSSPPTNIPTTCSIPQGMHSSPTRPKPAKQQARVWPHKQTWHLLNEHLMLVGGLVQRAAPTWTNQRCPAREDAVTFPGGAN